jgi:hypothetical protein
VRLLFHSRANRRTNKSNLNLVYQGGLQLYSDFSIEHKLVNEITASGSRKIESVTAGVRFYGRMKLYLNDILDYSTGSGTVFLAIPALFDLNNEFSFRYKLHGYRSFPVYDYRLKEIQWKINRKLRQHSLLGLHLSIGGLRYDRPALSVTTGNNEIIYLEEKQKDDYFHSEILIGYSKKIVATFRYAFQYNNSNSYGYSYSRHQFVIVFGLGLPKRFWLRSYAALQFKNYRETLVPVFPTDIDPERDESNFFVFDLSKDFNPHVTALLRVGIYNNESVIRDLFYKKILLTTGLDFRF